MTVTFDATAGGASANSYISVEDADDLMARRLHETNWTGATSATKKASLMWATRILDRYNWKGTKTSSTQALRHPRTYILDLDGNELSGTTIAFFLEEATVELALFLIEDDRTADPDGMGFKRLKVGSLELEPDTVRAPNVLPKSVIDLINPYLISPVNSSVMRLSRG
jgi:hypothetical protein